jgi:hypothetical protein
MIAAQCEQVPQKRKLLCKVENKNGDAKEILRQRASVMPLGPHFYIAHKRRRPLSSLHRLVV